MAAHAITGYFVSMTTLEEVFLKLQSDEAEKEEKEAGGYLFCSVLRVEAKTKSTLFLPCVPSHHPTEEEITIVPLAKDPVTFWQKLKIFQALRYKQIMRNRKSHLYTVFVPLYFMILGLVFFKFIPQPLVSEVTFFSFLFFSFLFFLSFLSLLCIIPTPSRLLF